MDINEKLMTAVSDNNLEQVKECLAQGADVNYIELDSAKWTPLLQIAYNTTNKDKSYEIAKILVENNADVNYKSTSGKTALHLVSNIKIAKLLIEKGADVNARDDSRNTPLIWAIRKGQIESCKMLIEKGANINIKDYDGKNPLDIAKKLNHTEIVKCLTQTKLKTKTKSKSNDFEMNM